MKTAKMYMSEANSEVEKIDINEAIEKHSSNSATFVDVRDSAEIDKTGTIKNALRIPRGMIEFIADDSTAIYNPNLKKEDEIILICGAGGQAALTGKTMKEMGYQNVKNAGGIGDWEKNNGPMDK